MSMERYTDAYDVTWPTPSDGPNGSMPIGNGEVGLNVWAERDGSIVFYVARTDAWSENARLLKLGRVRVAFSPTPFDSPNFRQRLNLWDGRIEFEGGDKRRPFRAVLWVDAQAPVVHLEVQAPDGVMVKVAAELWRTKRRRLEGDELFSAYGLVKAPHPVFVEPDTVLSSGRDELVWCHHNRRSIWRETLELQGLKEFADRHEDPLINLAFGCIVRGSGLMKISDTELASEGPLPETDITVCCVTAKAATAEGWAIRAREVMDRALKRETAEARGATRRWWNDFWHRSYLLVGGFPEAEVVNRGYTLQRFMNACAGRGRYPIKFNGSLFTVDAKVRGQKFDADYRRWGGPYWFQNTRLAYWPMLKAGDFEMMMPLFRMYFDALDLARERTRVYFGHGGAYFPETMYFWGAYANDNYGWDRRGKPVSHVDNTFIRHYYSCALELLALMLDYFAYTGDEDFAREMLLPMAREVLTFYAEHFPRDERGRLLLKPSQALETVQKAINPLPDIAGLKYVLWRLLELPDGIVPEEQVRAWRELELIVPPVPTEGIDGEEILARAEKPLEPDHNIENPELYAVFPFRLYGVGRADLEMARRTYARRRNPGHRGWNQDEIHAAYLGLGDEAGRMLIERFSHKHGPSRFPAFWGPNFDWVPDQDHGCSGMIALQAMALQAEGDRIFVLPAWPAGWDVRFRMHAPAGTTVECEASGGRIRKLSVQPPGRADDLVVMAEGAP